MMRIDSGLVQRVQSRRLAEARERLLSRLLADAQPEQLSPRERECAFMTKTENPRFKCYRPRHLNAYLPVIEFD